MAQATDRDECRREVAARGLTPAAVGHLTNDALGRVDFAVLTPVKGLLKRFFSEEPWTADDDRALAEHVGAGEGWWEHALADDLVLRFGWRQGAFGLDVTRRPGGRGLVAETFELPVVPEATPNPRSIRFVTGPIHEGPSRWYESAAGVDDRRVAQLFGDFDDIDNVLVGPDFVAVGLRRPDRWEDLLVPVLRVVAAQFTPDSALVGDAPAGSPAARSTAPPRATSERTPDERGGQLERAWRELGRLRPDQPDELERLLAAAESPTIVDRQVAARLIEGAAPDTAASVWDRLLGDPSRSVRRAVVDAMVDAERPALRPLLERALADADAWIRWKAISGLVGIGIAASRSVVAPLASDPDFRVRLETASALRRADYACVNVEPYSTSRSPDGAIERSATGRSTTNSVR